MPDNFFLCEKKLPDLSQKLPVWHHCQPQQRMRFCANRMAQWTCVCVCVYIVSHLKISKNTHNRRLRMQSPITHTWIDEVERQIERKEVKFTGRVLSSRYIVSVSFVTDVFLVCTKSGLRVVVCWSNCKKFVVTSKCGFSQKLNARRELCVCCFAYGSASQCN